MLLGGRLFRSWLGENRYGTWDVGNPEAWDLVCVNNALSACYVSNGFSLVVFRSGKMNLGGQKDRNLINGWHGCCTIISNDECIDISCCPLFGLLSRRDPPALTVQCKMGLAVGVKSRKNSFLMRLSDLATFHFLALPFASKTTVHATFTCDVWLGSGR
jgi:hypothetical protein